MPRVKQAIAETESAPEEKVKRRSVKLNLEEQKLKLVDKNTGETTEFEVGDYPETTQVFLMLSGLAKYLTLAKDLSAANEKLLEGIENLPKRGGRGRASPWRDAIAAAVMEKAKKAGVAMTIETANVKAKAVDKDTLVELKMDPDVLKHFRKLTNKGGESALSQLYA